MKKAAIFSNNPSDVNRVYNSNHQAQLAKITNLYPHIINLRDISLHLEKLRDLEVIFSTWGMFKLDDEVLSQLPELKAVFYAAGSVRNFAGNLLEQNIQVFSAWRANAIPVAEFSLGQILLANKGYFRNFRDCATPTGRASTPFRGRGNFGATVAILGFGAVGSYLFKLLQPFRLKIIVFAPFLPDDQARSLGVQKVSLTSAFQRADVVTNHLASNSETHYLLDKHLFNSMKDNAVFINTGRGATVVEMDLISVLEERPTLTALLDVTFPEPPELTSPFYSMENVILTSHIAGSMNDELARMADYIIHEFLRWERKEPLQNQVTLDMLATLG